MNDQERNNLNIYREQGYSIYALAKVMNISYATAKQHCRAHHIIPTEELKSSDENAKLNLCENCGNVFAAKIKSERTMFCSGACRAAYNRRIKKYEEEQTRLEQLEYQDEDLEKVELPPRRTELPIFTNEICRKNSSDQTIKDWTYLPKRAMNGSAIDTAQENQKEVRK